MLIHPWDEAPATSGTTSWPQPTSVSWSRPDTSTATRSSCPPTSCTTATRPVLLHLARPNPVWRALDADPHVVLALAADYVYVEAAWNAEPGTDPDARRAHVATTPRVQLLCRAEIVDDPDEKAALLAQQLAHFEPPRLHAASRRARRSRATVGSCPASAACGCTSRRCGPRRSTAATRRPSTATQIADSSPSATARWTPRPGTTCYGARPDTS